MNLIITAGGTRERIDDVRSITNDATGKLGSLIAKEFSEKLVSQIHTIYYICGITSVVPNLEDSNIQIIRIESTQQLQDQISSLLRTQKIDAVIHSMAVSDYTVNSVTTPEFIAEEVIKKINELTLPISSEKCNEIIVQAVVQQKFKDEHKISSDLECPIIVLKKTPKIIGSIKEISPETLLVGFKLLSAVSEESLIEVANSLLTKNKCDFVFANDMNSINNGNHEGYLIDTNKNSIHFSSKENIAKGIVDNVLKKLGRV